MTLFCCAPPTPHLFTPRAAAAEADDAARVAALESQQKVAQQLAALQAQQAVMAQQLAAAQAANETLRGELVAVQVGGGCDRRGAGLSLIHI